MEAGEVLAGFHNSFVVKSAATVPKENNKHKNRQQMWKKKKKKSYTRGEASLQTDRWWRRPQHAGNSVSRRASSHFPINPRTLPHNEAHSFFISPKTPPNKNIPDRLRPHAELQGGLIPPLPRERPNPAPGVIVKPLPKVRELWWSVELCYVPTPYFSFLLGTQRDIVGVVACLRGCRWSG